MNNKNYKTLLNLIGLAVVAFSIVSLFGTIVVYDTKDMCKEKGYSLASEYSIEIDYSVVYAKVLFGNGESSVHIMQIIIYNDDGFKLAEPDTYQFVPALLIFVFGPVIFILFFYFCYTGVKNFVNKRTKHFLYAGSVMILITTGFIIISYVNVSMIDVVDYNFVGFGYGFYCMVLSIILSFVAYYIQYYKIDYSES